MTGLLIIIDLGSNESKQIVNTNEYKTYFEWEDKISLYSTLTFSRLNCANRIELASVMIFGIEKYEILIIL